MKKKLKIIDLKVQSFVTEVKTDSEIKGGNQVNLSQVNCPSGLLNPCLTGTETWNFPCTHGGCE